MKVIWTPRAQLRLQQVVDHIAEDQPVNAKRWVRAILARGEQIASQPRSGRQVREYADVHVREVIEGNYRIIYRLRPSQIDVLTVRHAARPLPRHRRDL
ncbi:type II toxin-antitoxin system RelE/ParE family toxin [Abyssibacter sp.]|uniref:type II toxin-antitoxin system RelE/ParE family toxin n=1 Tax=Abyssibacter sp. TaxID=2320200 RepID=UPI003513CD4A